MTIPWEDLLYSDSFHGEPNKPFERFLYTNTRIATIGHNENSILAHKNALESLSEDLWAACNGFEFDERAARETVDKKLSQVPGLTGSEKQSFVEKAEKFAYRQQVKRYFQSQYIALLLTHFQALNNDKPNIDWQWLLYKPSKKTGQNTLFQACETIAKRIFWKEEMARQATDAVLKRLSDNHWAKLSGYQGKGSAEGYFKKVFHTQAQDFFKTIYGSCQPKTWIRNAGQMMVLLYKKMCCEKIEPKMLVENPEAIVRALRQLDAGALSIDTAHLLGTIRNSTQLIMAREPNCLQRKVEEVAATDIVKEDMSIADFNVTASFEADLQLEEWKATLLAMQIVIGNITYDQAAEQLKEELKDASLPHFQMVKKVADILGRLDSQSLKQLQMTDNEKLVLQYRFLQGLTIKETAETLTLQLRKTYKPHQVVYSEKIALGKLEKMLGEK